MVVLFNSLPTSQATQSGKNEPFPTGAIEIAAYQCLLRASQQTALTGVFTQSASLSVNGHTLPTGTLRVAGQTYVPVAEFARAAGLTSRWNNKTGVLTLSGAGRKPVILMAGGMGATVARARVLSVPVLKQNGQAVMTLTDLLAVMGGRIVGKSGNTVQVKG